MTTGDPLLLSSSGGVDSPSKQQAPARCSVGSLGCLCRTDSFSSSLYEDCDTASVNLVDDGEAVPRHLQEESDVNRTAERFQSADSHFFNRLSVECSQKERQRKVSWGGVMEMQRSPSSFEIGAVPSSHEKPNRSQRVRNKSTQFEDPFSSEHDPRLIYINDPDRTNDRYEFTGNEIRTSKYTLITFLPKNLFIQFHRLAYVYFLVIAALNQLPPLAVFGRTASLFPLLFVLFVTAIKDGYEDWRRHRSDRNENNREALVFQHGDFRPKKWKSICAGEVVKIHSNETMPCDMVLLGTSDPNGIAYIQTMNLDESLRQNGNKPKSVINVDPGLLGLLNQPLVGDERLAAHDFFLTLAACNTVIPVSTESFDLTNKVNEIGAIDYQGESPDEQALVIAASAYGYTLVERTTGHIVIDVQGERIRLDVLGLHEFDSVRKRMSVVVRFPDNNVKVLVKGADTSMLSILKRGISDGLYNLHDKIREATENHLSGYSTEGLRTLVIGSKNLTDAEFSEWQEKYEEASTSMHERSAKLRQAAGLVECDLTLLGATAIEDKLQDGVPEAIESLRQAGIKVWVLTGDKQETAISIGLSCRLLTENMHSIIINGSSEVECRRLLADAKAKFGIKSAHFGRDSEGIEDLCNGDVSKPRSSNGHIPESSTIHSFQLTGVVAGDKSEHSEKVTNFDNAELALIIDGSSLVYILEKDLESELFDLATSCKVVICCRVAPLQKAGIVDLIKSRTSDMTLAIGDGANDVSMIQMADVGVGICGQEGRQAVMASDFAMGQFHFLKRLLLVHGHWNYQRIAYMILYNFYRNAVFVLMLFWYILYTAYSATLALTDWSSVFYSLIYTSVPTVVVGILDKDLSHNTLLYYPRLYEAGLRNEGYNLTLFWITMLDTLWQSLVLFYVPFFTYNISTMDIWSLGSLWTIAVVIIVNIHLAMDIQRWVLITHLAVWGSIAATFLCMVLIDSIPIFPNYG
ncbi:hypothetical protein PR202_ga25852 [Eleusine coracana subsp. coracana]|uniref:Phospholipid-transporting ATPase n=1 Tax=Eleusine coracana subsp. coracana TaxID=191504 RepID=A0AAV5DCH2_ELECO|nr:hypothetical protein PR202_ga25852 [Eleusine coracana subsp. coracana]